MNREQTEDLKAFEQRLRECVSYTRTETWKWKVFLSLASMWLLVSFCLWWMDDADYDSYLEVMKGNKNLTLSCFFMLSVYLLGVFSKCKASKIITSRCKKVLVDYNMSCDEQGKLILKRNQSKESWKPG